MTNSIPDFWERESDIVIAGNDWEREREWRQKIGSNFVCCRKNKRRLLYHLTIKFFALYYIKTSTNVINYNM